MNILVLNYEFPPIGGGASPVSYDISKGYVKHGHNVYVVTMHYNDLPFEDNSDGIHIYRVRCLRKKRFVCYPWEQLTYIISALKFLKRFLKRTKIDFVHAHFIIPTGVIAQYIKNKYGIPYIITAHGSDVPGYNTKRFTLLHKLLRNPWKSIIRDANKIVSPSHFLEDLLIKGISTDLGKTINKDKICIVQNGIDTSVYNPSKKKKIILLMGRLQETKGMQDVLSALDKKLLADWSVAIVGDGPYRTELEKIVNDKDISESVKFYGWIEAKSDQQLKLLSEAAIFMSGSYFENCPMTIMEAYCSGCKLVLSDIQGHREIAVDKAVYFEPGNIENTRNVIKDCIESYDMVASVNVDKASYEWEYRIDQYEKIMQGKLA